MPETDVKTFEIEGIKYKAIFNPIATDNLIQNTQFCQQKLIEFAVEFEGKFSVSQTLIIMQREGRLVSLLTQYIGRADFEKEGVATFEVVKPFIDKHIKEIAERRKKMRK